MGMPELRPCLNRMRARRANTTAQHSPTRQDVLPGQPLCYVDGSFLLGAHFVIDAPGAHLNGEVHPGRSFSTVQGLAEARKCILRYCCSVRWRG